MFPALKLAALIGLSHYTHAIPQTTTAPATTTVPALTISTSVTRPSVPLSALVASQAPLPPVQEWCIGQIFCPGALLQTVNLAQVYTDAKIIVDKPTRVSSQKVLAEFATFDPSTVIEDDIANFENNYFLEEGLELESTVLPGFNANPPFLSSIVDPLIQAFARIVNGYWTQLARTVNKSALCSIYPEGTCESTFIPLNHTFIIPGGRFRENYYWDSYWIIQGLLKSELYDTVNGTLHNFMDEIHDFGYIPNGGRKYYLNRSQPPMFIHMLYDYVTITGDTLILERGLPSAEAELEWWSNNRTIQVTSPYTDQTYSMARYAVTNSAPRPESYLEDYQTVYDPTLTPLTDSQAAELYSNLASGAETGWDFSSRFEADPQLGNPGLRTLNVRNNIPVCLNSILYKAHVLLANLYGNSNAAAAANHLDIATGIRSGILDLMWDSSKLAFYDFNLTSNSRNSIFTAATFYPVWNDIIPDEILASQANAFGYFATVNMAMNKYNGTFPATFVDWTALQWDAPNTWPPHQYIIINALEALPSNLTTNALPIPGSGQSTYDLIPAGQLNFTEAQLPGQPFFDNPSVNVTATGPGADINKLDGTVVNGGNATAGEGWATTLKREMVNRYVTSVLCSWHATGGAIPDMLPQLPGSPLNSTGNMFEKFSNLNVDSSGFGGEYTVQAGFGWTNGVLLWAAANYGPLLVAPQCPLLGGTVTGNSNGVVRWRLSSSLIGAMGVAVVASLIWMFVARTLLGNRSMGSLRDEGSEKREKDGAR